MRKIEENMRHAVQHQRNWRQANTSVSYNDSTQESTVYLHGHVIATYWHKSGELDVNKPVLARWPTPTTKSRLRALGADVYTKNYVTFLNGEPV